MGDVPLAEILRRSSEPEKLDPAATYPTAGVFSWGRGLFTRPVVRGADVSYSTYYRIHPKQFLYSKLFAWEGALAVVGPEFEGYFVSQEFPVFDITESMATPGYVKILCSWPMVWDRVRAGETGMGGRRRRVHPDRLLEVRVPLPSIDEQRRIVDLVATVDETIEAGENVLSQALVAEGALQNKLFHALLADSTVRLADVVDVVTGRQRSPKHAQGEHMLRYIRAANVKDGRLVLDQPQLMNFSPSEQRRYSLRRGDVLVTEGCGSRRQIGASCEWNEEIPGTVCYQNHLLRLRTRSEGSVPQRLVYHWAVWAFRSGIFADIATGTNILSLGSTRVEQLAFPGGESADVAETVAVLDAAAALSSAVADALQAQKQLRSALLDDLLSGEHEIQGSYDELLSA